MHTFDVVIDLSFDIGVHAIAMPYEIGGFSAK